MRWPWSKAKPSAPKPLDRDGLIFQAAHLRDHLMRTKGTDSTALTAALQPFEDTDQPGPADPKDTIKLVQAFQEAYDNAQALLDERTLLDVLVGKSPYIYRDSKVSSICLVLLGALLVMSAFHYTYWSTKATSALQASEKFAEFQHLDELVKAVQLRLDFANSPNVGEPAQPGPVAVSTTGVEYMQQLSTLKSQYQLEATLPVSMNNLRYNFNPPGQFYTYLRKQYCEGRPDTTAQNAEPETGFVAVVLHCPPKAVLEKKVADTDAEDIAANTDAEDATDNAPDVTRDQTDIGGLGQIGLADQPTDTLDQALRSGLTVVQTQAGRIPLGDYEHTIFAVNSLKRELNQRLNIVRFWALPIIYGALGALVYCLWRTLTPSVSGLGFWHPIMRMIFGSLAALTFSMLLIPANVLSIGLEAQTPIVYLLSFIFGYSVDGFVRILNVLNAFIASNTVVKSEKPAAATT